MNRADLPETEIARCGSCRREGVWTITQDGNRMLVELEQGSDGNLALTVDGTTVRSRVVKASLAFGRQDLHKPHYANCPNAGQHRRPKGRTHA